MVAGDKHSHSAVHRAWEIEQQKQQSARLSEKTQPLEPMLALPVVNDGCSLEPRQEQQQVLHELSLFQALPAGFTLQSWTGPQLSQLALRWGSEASLSAANRGQRGGEQSWLRGLPAVQQAAAISSLAALGREGLHRQQAQGGAPQLRLSQQELTDIQWAVAHAGELCTGTQWSVE
jgi:hypothetical protein